ncbi:universal stress protein [Nostoc sp. FACHB-973]|uniref:Universal stress protein n=1 Tax=Desmonostoc muscorum LEGE 12446 TaxID=1828758 RepID=A0A8J6ZTA0_DESMC|nr:universal stress protein [Desmonostoc muscorum]MBD2516494.1 universal stress protein [Nostoc sp. FACHB-973]MBX9255838.1 universal stress protein [Desmonostoc muscorum CCALA 125]MCF2150471.1 universal stress protein [Desmonostoc muscorum LEGE 12446]
MFKKILVALDRSEVGQKVFDQALGLAKLTQASLMLVHVLSPEEEGSPYVPMVSNFDYYPGLNSQSFELYQKQWDTFKNQGIQMLQSFCAQANTAGITTEFTQNLGNPGRIVCDLARSYGADLIVMGRRGRSGLTELFLGSVSNYVLHHAPCSVHIVHLSVTAKKDELVKETTSVSSVN